MLSQTLAVQFEENDAQKHVMLLSSNGRSIDSSVIVSRFQLR